MHIIAVLTSSNSCNRILEDHSKMLTPVCTQNSTFFPMTSGFPGEFGDYPPSRWFSSKHEVKFMGLKTSASWRQTWCSSLRPSSLFWPQNFPLEGYGFLSLSMWPSSNFSWALLCCIPSRSLLLGLQCLSLRWSNYGHWQLNLCNFIADWRLFVCGTGLLAEDIHLSFLV